MGKRPLGLGKKLQEKKRKVQSESEESSKEPTPAANNQIAVELDDAVDLDDEFAQLEGLWTTYFHSDRDSEFVLNGIVHECDRLLRESQENEETRKKIDDKFHAIYALALSELTIFKAGEDESKKSVSQFFDNAMERAQLGLDQFGQSTLLPLVQAKIILQRIPLQYISELSVESKAADVDLYKMLEDAKQLFQVYDKDTELTFEVLQMMDDLIDIVENFGHGKDIEEGLDSDDEEELSQVSLSPNHPLYKIQQQLADNREWLKQNLINLLQVSKNSKLYHSIAQAIGQLYLREAEKSSAQFMELQYGDDENTENSKEAKQAQKAALQLTKTALDYLEKAQLDDDPETWVQVAEAYIDLGNLQDFQSKEQEDTYKKAEKILQKANKSSHGKYQDILDNLAEKN